MARPLEDQMKKEGGSNQRHDNADRQFRRRHDSARDNVSGYGERSFGGEVEALSTPMICRLPDSRRHQLPRIALMGPD